MRYVHKPDTIELRMGFPKFSIRLNEFQVADTLIWKRSYIDIFDILVQTIATEGKFEKCTRSNSIRVSYIFVRIMQSS